MRHSYLNSNIVLAISLSEKPRAERMIPELIYAARQKANVCLNLSLPDCLSKGCLWISAVNAWFA
ncbi:Uncharacterised protein [Vibrio cholerae]|nr:Uncharacterised protein [Vibrio cholerae]CSI37907.1 Uncharacterised protein [Vibrio cholerae]